MKYKAVSWDIMHTLFKGFNDHQLHSVIYLNSHIDEKCLYKAVDMSACAFPILKCKFVEKSFWKFPYWEDCNYTSHDMITMIKTKDAENQIEKLIVYKTKEAEGPQMKLYIVRSMYKDALCIIFNHMIADAAGFRQYLYMLSSIYSNLKKNPDYIHRYKMGMRSTKQIFKDFSFLEKIKIFMTSSQLSRYNTGQSFPIEGNNDNPFILKTKISKDKYLSMKDYAKRNNVTINDMLLTVYIRTLNEMFNIKRIPLPCPVNLRKYLNNKDSVGISNFISNMICDVECADGDTYKDTLFKVKKCMDKEKRSRSCLNGPLMLDIVFDVLPYKIAKGIVGKTFINPLVAMTNIGIIDKNELVFDDLIVTDAFICGAIKYKPYFQIAVTTFDNEITLTSNFHGTENDKKRIDDFLQLFACNCNMLNFNNF